MHRRRFLKLGFAGLGAVATLNASRYTDVPAAEDVCFMFANHWSYIGIGWQLGIESCALSILDSLNIADEKPYAKTCINLDARAYELLAQEYPLLCERLKRYLEDDKVELIAGSYSQPMGTLFSGESNIRQVVIGQETIRKSLGVELESFLDEEEFSHPQMPQILSSAGYKYASLSQLDTWAYAGCPNLPLNIFHWKGLDGSTILCQAKNKLLSNNHELGLKFFPTSEGQEEIKKLQKLGKPCIQHWKELGWEDPETPLYLTLPGEFAELGKKYNIEFVTIRGYLSKYRDQTRESIYLNMDAWQKLLPWGIGGDQIRVNARKIEATLHAAERFDAIASTLGSKSKAEVLDKAWRDLLTAQSHDVNLCEFSRWQGHRMAPTGLIEDRHGQTWGSIGYHHLDQAKKSSTEVLNASLADIANRISSSQQEGLKVVVFNPCSWERTSLASTGKIYLKDRRAQNVLLLNRSGEAVPFELEQCEKDGAGNLEMIDITFLAENVPSVGYESYSLQFNRAPIAQPQTDLLVDETNFEVENAFVKIRLDPTHGGLTSLVDKKLGKEFISAEKFCTPAFHGQPNLKYPFLANDYDTSYDSSAMKGVLTWVEKGPLRVTLKAVHKWRQLTFETRVSLNSHSPRVEILTRILTDVPPALDDFPDGRAERTTNNGYWLAFAPAFSVENVHRDFPLGVETTKNERLHGLTFVDLTGPECGLLIVHSGNQYFRKEADGSWSNLVMREWESHFTRQYGFTNYVEFKHVLLAHDSTMDDAPRVRTAMEVDNNFFTIVSKSKVGVLPSSKSFMKITPDNVILSAFHKRLDSGYCVRVLETSGRKSEAQIELGFPYAKAVETDLRGHLIDRSTITNRGTGNVSLPMSPWQFRNVKLDGS